MNNLWLTFITQDRVKDIDEMTRDSFDRFDGIVAVDHFSTDGTYELLESRKKSGKIIQRPFVKHHAHSMNEFLFSGTIKNLDWFLILDSSDRINPTWLNQIRDNISYWDKKNIGGIALDRIFLVKYIDSMEFFGGIHWGLSPLTGQVLDLSRVDGYRKENYIINTRVDNKTRSSLFNPIKYYYCYGANSQTELLYRQFGDNIWQERENLRIKFRLFCQYELKLEFTMESLEKYMVENVGKYYSFFEEVLEHEVNVLDMFRWKVLKQDPEEIYSNRFNFSYFRWKDEGIVDQDKFDGYIGDFNRYRLNKGLSME